MPNALLERPELVKSENAHIFQVGIQLTVHLGQHSCTSSTKLANQRTSSKHLVASLSHAVVHAQRA